MARKIPTGIKYHLISTVYDLGRVCLVVSVVALIASLLFYHVSNQIRITRLGYRIAEVTAEHRHLLEENKKLTIEAAVQGRTERVANVAQDEFGLHPVRPDQIRKISKSLIAEVNRQILAKAALENTKSQSNNTNESRE